jgi:hypothetical protein
MLRLGATLNRIEEGMVFETQAVRVAPDTQAVCHLIAHRPVDAFVVVYTDLDRVLHHCWYAMAPRHELHDAGPSPVSFYYDCLDHTYTINIKS